MSDIKTKETHKDIKVLDKSAAVMRNMKKATVRTKDGLENLIDDGQISPSEYAEDQMKYAAEDTAEAAYDKTSKKIRQGRDRVKEQLREKRAEKRLENKKAGVDKKAEAVDDPRLHHSGSQPEEPKNARSASRRTVRQAKHVKQATVRAKEKVAQNQAVRQTDRQARSAVHATNTGIETVQTTERSIKQTARSIGKTGIKTVRYSAKTAERTVKTAEQTSKAVIKTAKVTAETAPKAAEATVKAAKASAIAAKKTAIAIGKAVVAAAKVVAKVAVAVGKAIASAFSALVAALGMGGAIIVVVVAVIGGIALIVGSAGGIFYSSEDASGQSMESVVREINTEYNDRLALVKEVNTYDEVEMSGSSAVWWEVLAYYAVKTSMADEDAQEVVTLDPEKIELLKEVFWEMNTISSEVRTETKTVVEETVDEDGEVIEIEVEKEITTLYITVSHLSADEMAEKHGLSEKQKDMMHTLLSNDFRSVWSAVLYGIKSGETAIIDVAASQLGNEGGEPYWSHFGFSNRIPWCACFVTWCGNECGYVENGIMPNAIGCVVMMNWYKERGQWINGNNEPVPGMIIFYDWDDPDGEFGAQDGKPDHVGIVEKVVDGMIWTIEGNSGDSCRQNQHSIGECEIMGYGCPNY